MSKSDRRWFLQQAASLLVLPVAGPATLVGCAGAAPEARSGGAPGPGDAAPPVPARRPRDWDAVRFNLKRGKGGAIPDSYLDDVTGPDGIAKHLGKHLPYLPRLEGAPDRMLPIMWGDPAKGHARHPNAPPSADNPEGHWYDWIRVALDGDPSSEVETRFDGWPDVTTAVNGQYRPLEGDDVTGDGGKNTVYLAELPRGATGGSTLRVWAHCLTHGEYVDFVQLGA